MRNPLRWKIAHLQFGAIWLESSHSLGHGRAAWRTAGHRTVRRHRSSWFRQPSLPLAQFPWTRSVSPIGFQILLVAHISTDSKHSWRARRASASRIAGCLLCTADRCAPFGLVACLRGRYARALVRDACIAAVVSPRRRPKFERDALRDVSQGFWRRGSYSPRSGSIACKSERSARCCYRLPSYLAI